ncbi:MAG: SMC family ATPase [Dehalococcoidia bacterium]|nr:SMC family ATPase [Dehalococcoidia bacterium]
MRPRNLRLAGFTCYSDPIEIDFTDLDLFVISGPTGSGKSTLIDAICYALYGRVPRGDGRKTTSLISHNRDNMRVALDFEAGGERYRVSRGINTTRKTARDGSERVATNVSPVVLERLIGGDHWLPMQDRVQTIDREIERIIGLDFDGFTRCVLLPQGKFQEFLTGDAKERRELLKELLGTQIYEDVRSAAAARARELDAGAKNIERRLSEDYREATPETLVATREELAAIGPQLAQTREHRDALQRGVELADKVVFALDRQRTLTKQRDEMLAEVERLRELAASAEQRVTALRRRIAEHEAALESAGYDVELHARLRTAADRAKQANALERDLAAVQDVLADTRRIEEAAAACAAAERSAAAAVAARELTEARRDDARRDESAEHLRHNLKRGDACPVCGATVATLPKTKAGSIAAAEKAVADAKSAERRTQDASRAAEMALQSQRQAHDRARDDATKLEQQRAALRDEIAALLPGTAGSDPETIAAALGGQDAAAARVRELTHVRDEARRALETLQPEATEAATKIAADVRTAQQLAENAAAEAKEAAASRASLAELAGAWRWDDVAAMLRATPPQNPRASLRSLLEACQSEAETLNRRHAALEQSAQRLERDIARAEELQHELTVSKAQAARHRELARLLRADNFQAYVIEEAMQALAANATAHLATLYDRFALSVEGGEFLVTDHWQADQARPARTLSGGETFIASLALALALSERLPELRSGASAVLESLFLDEGFGTLDEEVLDVVITALEGLRSEDRMVGIISHVPDLPRRIGARITVKKSPAGSLIAMA